jgi:hypothetical protein
LVYVDDFNLLGNSINTIKENTESLLEARRDVGIQINAEKTKYMIMSHHLNSGKNQHMMNHLKIWQNSNTWDGRNQNDIHDEIKSRLNSRNACYHSVQNLLSSCLVSKNLKIKIYRTVILPVVLYGYKTWSLTFLEEHRLRVFENRVLRWIFGPKREEDRSWRKLYDDELDSLYSSLNIVRVIKLRMMRWEGHAAHLGEGRGVYGVLVERNKETTGKT